MRSQKRAITHSPTAEPHVRSVMCSSMPTKGPTTAGEQMYMKQGAYNGRRYQAVWVGWWVEGDVDAGAMPAF